MPSLDPRVDPGGKAQRIGPQAGAVVFAECWELAPNGWYGCDVEPPFIGSGMVLQEGLDSAPRDEGSAVGDQVGLYDLTYCVGW